MKTLKRSIRTVIGVMLLVGPPACIAQQAFIFENYWPALLDAPVFDAFGHRLAGTNYVAMLYGGISPGALHPAGAGARPVMDPIPFIFMPEGQAGYFRDGIVEVRDVPCLVPLWLQVRAWDTRLGSSYEQVVNLDLGGYGQSALFQLEGANFCDPNPPPPPHLIGLQSFSLLPVIPEPSPIWLLLLGLPLLALRRRRSKQT